MRPRPTEVMLKHIESVRAWGGGLILRGSTEEVKTTGRPQVRTTGGIHRAAEFTVTKRVPLFPLLKVLGFLRTFSKVLKWGLGRSPIVSHTRTNCGFVSADSRGRLSLRCIFIVCRQPNEMPCRFSGTQISPAPRTTVQGIKRLQIGFSWQISSQAFRLFFHTFRDHSAGKRGRLHQTQTCTPEASAPSGCSESHKLYHTVLSARPRSAD